MSQPKVRRKLNRMAVENAPYPDMELWNAFINLICMSDYEDLTPKQRVAHLAFWYDSEVSNGGHFQYFLNKGVTHLEETLKALNAIGAQCQRQILERASKLAPSLLLEEIETVEDYVEQASEDEFEALDLAYYECRPELGYELLNAYLLANLDEFIEFD